MSYNGTCYVTLLNRCVSASLRLDVLRVIIQYTTTEDVYLEIYCICSLKVVLQMVFRKLDKRWKLSHLFVSNLHMFIISWCNLICLFMKWYQLIHCPSLYFSRLSIIKIYIWNDKHFKYKVFKEEPFKY